MAAEGIASEERGVYHKHQRTHADTKSFSSGSRIVKPHSLPCVIGKDEYKDDRQVKKIPVNILQNEGKGVFTPVGLARFRDGTCRRIGPKGFVISAPVIITRDPHASRRPQDQKRRRKR